MQMLHPHGSGPDRPMNAPILIGALGPKGRAVAERHDGVFATTTVEGLEPGSSAGSPSPAARRRLAAIDERTEDERHLDVHIGHCIHLNDAHSAALGGDRSSTADIDDSHRIPDEVRARIDDLGAKASPRSMFQPCGPHTPPGAGGDVRRRQQLNAHERHDRNAESGEGRGEVGDGGRSTSGVGGRSARCRPVRFHIATALGSPPSTRRRTAASRRSMASSMAGSSVGSTVPVQPVGVGDESQPSRTVGGPPAEPAWSTSSSIGTHRRAR